LDFNPRPFAIMIAIAASCSFITPLEPACVIVFNAGKYRFFDFVRVGGLLTLLVYAIAIVLVPLVWSV
jgi:di/tricarboxylate transporter